MTKFFGKLFMINFALGLVTGIVQEFQFGMNWSLYSRFVGDIFGAPLAFEALLAFFLESTFLGCGSSGGTACPARSTSPTIWLTHRDGLLGILHPLPRTRFMQNPVGYTFNPKTNRAELDDFLAVLTNKVQLVTFPARHHRCVHDRGRLRHGRRALASCANARSRAAPADLPMYRKAALRGLGRRRRRPGRCRHRRPAGKVMTEVQPMKMAAA